MTAFLSGGAAGVIFSGMLCGDMMATCTGLIMLCLLRIAAALEKR